MLDRRALCTVCNVPSLCWTVSHMNYVIQLFSPCWSNRWAAVEKPVWEAASCIRLLFNVSDNNPDGAKPAHMRPCEAQTWAPRSAEAQTNGWFDKTLLCGGWNAAISWETHRDEPLISRMWDPDEVCCCNWSG